MAATAAIARGDMAIKRYASGLDTEKAHVLHDHTWKFRIQAITKGVRLTLKTNDTTNYYTILLGTCQEFEVSSMRGRTIYLIEDAASAACEVLEFLKAVDTIG